MGAQDRRLADFIRQFNDKEFFEAHETLEALWLETTGPDKDFYKGLIQCAVAFVHLRRNNLKGARKLHRTAHRYLSTFLPKYHGINTEKLLVDIGAFFATRVDEAERRGQAVDVDTLPTPQIN
jgi:predicted metal-dependent hydrolase